MIKSQTQELSMTIANNKIADSRDRRRLIGGSDARVIIGDNQAALLRLWQEKRGEVEHEDLSDNLAVQLGRTSTGAGLSATRSKQ